MSSIAEFLRARYTEAREREEAKRMPREGPRYEYEYTYDNGGTTYVRVDGGPRVPEDDKFWEQYGVSAASPAILADLDAKLAVLDLHARLPLGDFCTTCDAPLGIPGVPYGCATLRLLAVPFAAHPDYDERWRPWAPIPRPTARRSSATSKPSSRSRATPSTTSQTKSPT